MFSNAGMVGFKGVFVWVNIFFDWKNSITKEIAANERA